MLDIVLPPTWKYMMNKKDKVSALFVYTFL